MLCYLPLVFTSMSAFNYRDCIEQRYYHYVLDMLTYKYTYPTVLTLLFPANICLLRCWNI